MTAYSPKLDLSNYDFDGIVPADCDACDKRTRQERYEGHTMAIGLAVHHCLECGARKMA